MAEADQTAKAKREVEADPRDGKDHRAGGEGDDERLIQDQRGQRDGEHQHQKGGVKCRFADHSRRPEKALGPENQDRRHQDIDRHRREGRPDRRGR